MDKRNKEYISDLKKEKTDKTRKLKNRMTTYAIKPRVEELALMEANKPVKKKLKLLSVRPDKINISNPPKPFQVGSLVLEG